MYILGINISHHASLCLLKDGKVLFYLEEERLSRIKHSIEFDKDKNLLLSPFLRKFLSLKIIKQYTNHIDHIIFASYIREPEEDKKINQKILDELKILNITYSFAQFLQEHHLYHAYSGFIQSGFSKAKCLILDGGGAPSNKNNFQKFQEIESVYSLSLNNSFKPLFKHYSTNLLSTVYNLKFEKKVGCEYIYSSSISCGALFNLSCHFLNFKSTIAEAGKLMGLSSYGKDNKKFKSKWYWKLNNNWFSNSIVIGFLLYNLKKIPNTSQKAADFAFKLQKETFKYTLKLIKKFYNTSKKENIIISGGYALNCVNNYKYIKSLPKNVKLYIDPLGHDGGTSYGAAMYLWHKLNPNIKSKPIKNLYLGPKYSKEQLIEGIKKYV